MTHPLDCPAWSALNGRHQSFGLLHGNARRYALDRGVFAAVGDCSPASLAKLVIDYGNVALLEPDPPGDIPGVSIVS